jgi:SAM-dependent methyltransferase
VNREGWHGWDAYAPFYDWENARTLGRQDVPFWTRLIRGLRGRVLELGCGTGRIALPLARGGSPIVGIDRSAPMLSRAARAAKRSRARRTSRRRGSLTLVRGDIRSLPFGPGAFRAVLAPYGILQSLLRPGDLASTLEGVWKVLEPGGLFGVDLVPDVPKWREYRNQVRLRGRAAGGSHLTLIESVRQDRRRHLTTFEQCYVERKGRRRVSRRFRLTFRTLSVRRMTARLECAGFFVEALLGDYRGRPWDERAESWIILARRR